jgi:glycosyltransferase involved in cell wall biosynthesis
MIKILHVIDCMQNLGGAQEILVELARRLTPQTFSQTITRLHGKNSYKERLPGDQIPTFSFSSRKYHLFPIIWRFYKQLKNNTYDIIHLHLQISTVLGVVIARLCRVPKVIVTIYASKEQSSRWIFPTFALLVPFVDAFVGLTQHQLSGLTQHPLARPFLKRTKTILIPVGLDCKKIEETQKQKSTIRQELNIPPESPLVLNVARFRYRKGQEYLLRAMALVVQKISDVRCILVGHGPELQRLQQLTRELQLEKQVFFLVSRSDLPNFFQACDLFVNSSIFEAMGVIVYQAMACGKAVVSFNAGSVNEVVVDGETGVLVPVRDYEALAAGMVKLLNDKNLREKYGAAGRTRVEKYFQLDDKIKQYEELYQWIID